jgi:hypothetical protein
MKDFTSCTESLASREKMLFWKSNKRVFNFRLFDYMVPEYPLVFDSTRAKLKSRKRKIPDRSVPLSSDIGYLFAALMKTELELYRTIEAVKADLLSK